ncbi:MAG: molybdopterin-dependent oxidoreductase [Anaerolineae bacterium]|nr:molybdopterin-dependent oxidoreductase [Anaerolineae bacterium]
MGDSWIGKRVPKRDAAAKTTGTIIYGHDLRRPGMLHGKILRSPFPFAKIIRINTERAAAVPGVKAILTGEDVPDTRIGLGRDNPILNRHVVRRIGDEVAAVAATSMDAALEAISLIDVTYEPLPAILDASEALKAEALLIHDTRTSNLHDKRSYVHGDPDAALLEADVVVEDTFLIPYVAPTPMEPSVVIAEFDADGELTVYTTNQAPYLMQYELGQAVEMPPGRIRIKQTAIGGAFGRGLDVYPFEAVAVLLAQATRQPVRIAYDRQEEFLAAPLRQPVKVTIKTGALKDGTLWVRDARALLDIGAYASLGTVIPVVMAQVVGSLYRVPHARYEADLVYTNNPVTGAMRGFGGPQATLFVEAQMDRLAVALGMDPLSFRLQNANRPDETTPQGLKISTCGLKECLEMVGSMRDEHKEPSPPGKRRGIGFAATLNVGGGARMHRSDGSGVIVKVDDFGQVTITTGSTEIGQGTDVVLSQIVAETLGVSISAVRFVNGDTGVAPWDVGAHASRTTFVAGNAALQAAEEARRQILETAAELLKVDAGELVMRDGSVYVRGRPELGLPLDKIMRARHFRKDGQIVQAQGWYDPPNEQVGSDMVGNLSATYSFGAQAIEVEVDTETGQVKVLRVRTANDVGRVINPMLVEGQLEGGIHMGLGYALSETLFVEGGQVQNNSFREYGIFTAFDMPPIEIQNLETHDPLGPFGAKGVGEIGVAPVAPAVLNAIYDAVGIRLNRIPARPEMVLDALETLQSNDRTSR